MNAESNRPAVKKQRRNPFMSSSPPPLGKSQYPMNKNPYLLGREVAEPQAVASPGPFREMRPINPEKAVAVAAEKESN